MIGAVEPSAVADFRILVDGVDYSRQLRPALASLRLTEKRGDEADQLDIDLDDSDGSIALPRKGRRIELQLGWLSGVAAPIGLVDKGNFLIDQVGWGGPPDVIKIRARAADLTAGFRVRREATHRDTTLGAIARSIAQRHGLKAAIAAELDGVAVPILSQHHNSDMALLRRLGRDHDAVATVKRGTLILAPIGRGASTSGRALPTLVLARSDVGSGYSYEEIDRSADAGVEARWHDQETGDRQTVREGGAGGTPRRMRRVFHSEAAARQAAGAEASRAKRGEYSLDLSLPIGRVDLAPEQRIRVAGFKPPIDARTWLIAELTHILDGRGLSTGLKLETSI